MSDEGAFDSEAAMREAMGFSSFTTRRPKNQSVTSLHREYDPSKIGEFQPSALSSQVSVNGGEDTENRAENSSAEAKNKRPASDSASIVFSSEISNTNYTRAELEEWARGKKTSNGDMVYFKPGFVTEDPWARLREKIEIPS